MCLRLGFVIVFMAVMLPRLTVAQFTAEHAAISNLKKGKWEKAKGQLDKAIRKDSLNPSARYTLSVYFFTPANPDFQIDSAYRYAMESLSDFQHTTLKQRDRLRKIPLDSMVLIHHRERIDSAAFARAKAKNSESGYIEFLTRFTFASQRIQAIELRDEVSYLDALRENTYGAFLNYLNKYPESARASEARLRYEKLLFEAKTKDKKLVSYESFLLDYPATPYRKEVERQIFEISASSGEAQSFEKFLKKYPQSSKSKQARNILYYILKEDNAPFPSFVLNDSIRQVQQLEKQYLVPFLKNESFGFMNERGEELIKPSANQINVDYLCGNITDELILLDNKIVARNGKLIYEKEVIETESLGYGFMKVNTVACTQVVHYSGFVVVEECLQDAKLLKKNLLALKKNNQWSVWTLTGRKLMDFEWDEVQAVDDVLIFRKSGKYKLTRISDVVKVADQTPVIFTREFDEVKSILPGMIWVKVGAQQGVLNQNLTEWIKLDAQEITPSFFGAVSKTSVGVKLHSLNSGVSQNFFKALTNAPWVAVQEAGAWRLFDPNTKQFMSPAFDSIRFVGPLSIGSKNDTLRIYLTKENFIESLEKTHIKFLPGKDSLFFLMLELGEKKVVYNSNGKELFSGAFDKIEYNNDGFFTIFKKDKQGLVSSDGKLVIQPELSALGSIHQSVVQTLRDKKFGLIDVVRRKEIKAEYEKNVVLYNARVLTVFKNGFYGLIGWDNKVIMPFEYEEIRYWSDSVAIVKKNFNWVFYNFVEKRVMMDKIKTFKWVQNTDQEKVLIIQQENAYGVISNRRGTILPATYTDIINLGSETTPLYFTEKHVEEASIFVVIYYDKNGIQLRKQVYETDDYDKIYCSDN